MTKKFKPTAACPFERPCFDKDGKKEACWEPWSCGEKSWAKCKCGKKCGQFARYEQKMVFEED